ncbi:quercetin dioxygenase-like cupin family protein [Granulicella aggregans]|uniref:Quercetin dioxygenase-like cupin family protein n=1 Tax=Granulicella aggregans TaxID=474949 RepID=A0A7W7ZID7_9BACT|nr:cupin domain-containing protein [Granulicella aggregans]MBB5060490.1 quercetin dioxygenase-like cupin family protein [Granulicella aggregans]
MYKLWAVPILVFLIAVGDHPFVRAQSSGNPALPSCGAGDVKDGNPGTGPSVIKIKFRPGCVIPWHWHTPNERVVMISGSAKAEMKGMAPVMLKQGDFIVLSAKQVHQFTATTAVEIYDFSDSPFDIHYVDATGKEIPYQDALRSTQPAATKP